MDVAAAFSAAFGLIFGLDPQFLQIVGLSLRVTLTAVLLAALIGLPVGALLAISRFRGRDAVVVLVNGMMGLPPVVAGLLIFLLLSRSGPLGSLGLLFTPTAMIAAQTLLVLPIVVALTRSTVEELWPNIASIWPRSALRAGGRCRRCSGTGASRSRRACWRGSDAPAPRSAPC